MSYTSYYIYALKDPRKSPAAPFYIGKGTGSRAFEHELETGSGSKAKRIADIKNSGYEVIVSVMADNLTEVQALKLEAELISAFGTEATGGLLTNKVIPTGSLARITTAVTIPSGIPEKAQMGLTLLKDAILELAKANKAGIKNTDAVKALGLQSDYMGKQQDYLTYSILGLLIKEGRIGRQKIGKSVFHVSKVR
jgi:uncharacterized protein